MGKKVRERQRRILVKESQSTKGKLDAAKVRRKEKQTWLGLAHSALGSLLALAHSAPERVLCLTGQPLTATCEVCEQC